MTKNQFWLPFCGKIKLCNGVVLTGFLTRFEQGKTAFADLRKTHGTQCRYRLGGRPAWAQRNHAFDGATITLTTCLFIMHLQLAV